MQAGRLTLLCLLQQPGAGVDEIGQPVPGDWDTIAEVWCEPVYQSGIEVIRAGSDTAITKVSMGMRRRSGVTNAMRLVAKHEGTVFNINNVIPDARDRGRMFAACEQVS